MIGRWVGWKAAGEGQIWEEAKYEKRQQGSTGEGQQRVYNKNCVIFIYFYISIRIKDTILSFMFIGPSGVRALPLAAGINEGGHYFGPRVLRAPAEQTKVATILGN